MKKRVLALSLALALLLSGCSALLERGYLVVEPHDEKPVSDDDALRVENYQELVNAILYYVSRGQETGTIRLYNYSGDAETDLEAACLEVAREDPLGAYAVDYIKYEVGRIVSYYEAGIRITYRRTAEQMAGIVSVTGSSAIRAELAEAMEQFETERVLRIAYFDAETADLAALAREAYYAVPQAAFGMPEVTCALYPEETAGRHRIVEVTLTYPDTAEALREKQSILLQTARAALPQGLSGEAAARTLFERVREATVLPDGSGGATAYAALVEGSADSEGLALAYALLCSLAGMECTVVEQPAGETSHFCVRVDWGGGETVVDPSRSDGFGLTEAGAEG